MLLAEKLFETSAWPPMACSSSDEDDEVDEANLNFAAAEAVAWKANEARVRNLFLVPLLWKEPHTPRRLAEPVRAPGSMSGSRKPPRVNVPAPVVVAATSEEAANLQGFRFLRGGTPPEGSDINDVFNATNETYAHAMARLGREPDIRPLQRSKSEGSSLRSRSVPGRRLQPLGPRRPGKKRRKAEPVEDAPHSSSADLSHLRAIGASESTWHESVRRSAVESWRELQRDASYHTPFPSSSRLPPISRSRVTVQSEPNIRMAVFSLGRGDAPNPTRHVTDTRGELLPTSKELHWSPDGR